MGTVIDEVSQELMKSSSPKNVAKVGANKGVGEGQQSGVSHSYVWNILDGMS